MKWKYYIPHSWDSDTTGWEDVYLLPDMPGYSGDSIWLTVEALGGDQLTIEDLINALEMLDGARYAITDTDMLVATPPFTMKELLEWVAVWIRDAGLPFSGLVEAAFEEFADSNGHARMLSRLTLTDEKQQQTRSPL